MAFKHGKDTEIWLNGSDVSSFFNSADFSVDVDTAETTTFKNDWKTHLVGQSGASVDTGGLYDPTFTNVSSTLNVATGAVLSVLPAGGAAVGDNARLVSVLSTSFKESSPVGDVVAFQWSVLASGPVAFGKVLKPLASVTLDGNGTSVDNGAQTTAGAVAHLHVTSVSAADSIIVYIEDSADNTAWATIGTFASKTAAGAERISIAGTVRRYVRARWDVTGTAVDITFSAALARL